MKKIALTILATALTVVYYTQNNQITIKKPTAIKVDAISIFKEGIRGSIEKSIDGKNSFELIVGHNYWNNKTRKGLYDSTINRKRYFQHTLESFKTYTIEGHWNFYLTNKDKHLTGLYVSPYLGLMAGTVKYSFTTDQTVALFGKPNYVNIESSMFSISTGGKIGYKYNIKDNILLGVFLKIGYRIGKVSPYYENTDYIGEYYNVFSKSNVTGSDNGFGLNVGVIF